MIRQRLWRPTPAEPWLRRGQVRPLPSERLRSRAQAEPPGAGYGGKVSRRDTARGQAAVITACGRRAVISRTPRQSASSPAAPPSWLRRVPNRRAGIRSATSSALSSAGAAEYGDVPALPFILLRVEARCVKLFGCAHDGLDSACLLFDVNFPCRAIFSRVLDGCEQAAVGQIAAGWLFT